MEINLPNKGIFKGIGKLQARKPLKKKPFPEHNNIHNFEFTHNHPTNYKTSFQNFMRFDQSAYKNQKVKKNANESQINFGVDRGFNFESETKSCFRKFNQSQPPKQVLHRQEGLGLNQYEKRTGQRFPWRTTTQQTMNPLKLPLNKDIKYKYTRT